MTTHSSLLYQNKLKLSNNYIAKHPLYINVDQRYYNDRDSG